MLNQVVLVGRVQNLQKEFKDGKEMLNLRMIIPRTTKNADGVYENDIITITLFDSIAKNTEDYVGINELIGVKGRLANLNGIENTKVIAEKITFLSSSRN
jgi:single-stranded DNA-binding protein